MKILTLNTHSLLEENYEEKCRIFAEGICSTMPDVIALQEVNQTQSSSVISSCPLGFSAGEKPLREDNHAFKIANLLLKSGAEYNFVWCPVKQGYGKLDEGLAFFSLNPILIKDVFTISHTQKYEDWKKRKALIIQTGDMYFCTTHLGWWDDTEEPFKEQFERLNRKLADYKQIFLMGDFNCPDNAKGEGYSYVTSKGWHDLYTFALKKEGHHTVTGPIAGWKQNGNLRIDYIFSKEKIKADKISTEFDGIRNSVVSDHYAVLADFERGAI